MKRSEVRKNWREIVQEQAGSGLRVAEFCRLRGLPQASFYQWRRKLRGVQSGEQKQEHGGQRAAFVPLTITARNGVRVDLPCGAVVHLPPGDEGVLTQVLSLLLASNEAAPSSARATSSAERG